MKTRRFIINSRCIKNDSAFLEGELFRHIVRVLRLSPGDPIILVDEHGSEYDGMIDQVDSELATVKILQSNFVPSQEENGLRITVCQALPRGEKIDLILQKGTELGAYDFWLFGGQRSIVLVRENQRNNKLERWNRIVTEAARQCGRRTVPVVRWFPDAFQAAAAATHDLRLILWEAEHTRRLRETLVNISASESVIVSIGPEGGFDSRETELFVRHGFQSVSMGSRILRTETAAIAIITILQYIGGDI